MLFVPPSMPAVEAQDSEIPAWIKNNASWWAEGQIHDEAFVAGIQWLVANGIIAVEWEEGISGPTSELVYQTVIPAAKKPYSVILIHSTQNNTCSADEKEKAEAYGIMAEYLVSKTSRSNPTQVSAYCMELHCGTCFFINS